MSFEKIPIFLLSLTLIMLLPWQLRRVKAHLRKAKAQFRKADRMRRERLDKTN